MYGPKFKTGYFLLPFCTGVHRRPHRTPKDLELASLVVVVVVVVVSSKLMKKKNKNEILFG